VNVESDAKDELPLYVDYAGGPYPLLERMVAGSRVTALRRFVQRLSLDSTSRRNPRTQEYMRELVAQRHSSDSSTWITVTPEGGLDTPRLAAARRIVLLWRDGNGTGWSPLERVVFDCKAPDASVIVLNGRRREFELSRADWRRHQLRRALEKSFIPEIALGFGLLVVSPVLIVWDAIRGRT
jgi:hypothetical protein